MGPKSRSSVTFITKSFHTTACPGLLTRGTECSDPAPFLRRIARRGEGWDLTLCAVLVHFYDQGECYYSGFFKDGFKIASSEEIVLLIFNNLGNFP